jgi:hypothetical protein
MKHRDAAEPAVRSILKEGRVDPKSVVLLVIALVLVHSSWIILMRKGELTGKELAQAVPRLSWVEKGFPLLSIAWIVFIAIVCVALGLGFREKASRGLLYLGDAALASYAVAEGLFAALVGVYPIPMIERYTYVYEEGMALRRIGLVYAALAFAVVVAALLSFFGWWK